MTALSLMQVDSQPDGGSRITHVATSKLKGRLPPGLGEQVCYVVVSNHGCNLAMRFGYVIVPCS